MPQRRHLSEPRKLYRGEKVPIHTKPTDAGYDRGAERRRLSGKLPPPPPRPDLFEGVTGSDLDEPLLTAATSIRNDQDFMQMLIDSYMNRR